MAQASNVEQQIRRAGVAGDWDHAATLAIRSYGAEIISYLAVLSRHDDLIEDAFAEFSEALWRGLPRFEWRASLRTWLFTVARNAFLQLKRGESRRREQRLGTNTALRLAAELLEGSHRLIESERRRAISELREQLEEDERSLLALRVEHGMSWLEIAEVLDGTARPSSPDEAEKVRARMRKRFQRTKDKIRVLADRRGLLDKG